MLPWRISKAVVSIVSSSGTKIIVRSRIETNFKKCMRGENNINNIHVAIQMGRIFFLLRMRLSYKL